MTEVQTIAPVHSGSAVMPDTGFSLECHHSNQIVGSSEVMRSHTSEHIPSQLTHIWASEPLRQLLLDKLSIIPLQHCEQTIQDD